MSSAKAKKTREKKTTSEKKPKKEVKKETKKERKLEEGGSEMETGHKEKQIASESESEVR